MHDEDLREKFGVSYSFDITNESSRHAFSASARHGGHATTKQAVASVSKPNLSRIARSVEDGGWQLATPFVPETPASCQTTAPCPEGNRTSGQRTKGRRRGSSSPPPSHLSFPCEVRPRSRKLNREDEKPYAVPSRRPMIRSRSSPVANSITMRPLFLPMSTFTLVSS